jgi:hypothetical protein
MINLFCNDKAVPTKVSGEDASRFFVDLGHFLFIYYIYNVYYGIGLSTRLLR